MTLKKAFYIFVIFKKFSWFTILMVITHGIFYSLSDALKIEPLNRSLTNISIEA